jgi:sugar O-acyltransferase (sialic acid O-acetyltransferase NeuD family)
MTPTRTLLVFGAGGHGKVVADVGRSAGLVLAGFLDDDSSRDGTTFWGTSVIHWERFLRERARWPGVALGLGIGTNAIREESLQRLRAAGLEVATLVHASAVVAPSATLGEATVVMAGAVVNPDATVGEGSIVNSGAIVEHDCRLGRFVHLSPNAALGGTVRIGDRAHIGLGAVILPGLSVGADVRVGAGAVVNRDVPDGLTVVGVPARPIAASKKGTPSP